MKYFKILALIFFVSCSSDSSNSNYEKAIAEYIQTDKTGTKYDMKFKVLELSEVSSITVADSVNLLMESFNKEKESKLKSFESLLSKNQNDLEKEKKNRLPSKTMIGFYEKSIARQTQAIDSIKALQPENPYNEQKQDEVLVRVIQCKYSIVPPTVNTTVEENFNFFFSADGTILGKRKVK